MSLFLLTLIADGVTVFITGHEYVHILCISLALYESASSAKVNWANSEGFLVGPWENVGPPQLSGGLQWGNEVKSSQVYFYSTFKNNRVAPKCCTTNTIQQKQFIKKKIYIYNKKKIII